MSSQSTPRRWRRPSPSRSGSRSWARCGGAAPWSASRAASTARSSPPCASRRSGKERVLGIFMPERDSSDDALRLGRMLAVAPGHRGGRRGHRPGAPRALGCYARQNEAIRQVFPRVRRRLEVQDHAAVDPRQRSPERVPADRAGPRRRDRDVADAARRLPAARRGDQLQAARPQDDGVLPRRSPELRGRRARRTGWSTTRASS